MQCVPDTPSNRRAAGALLRRGGLVAYPTDTLYGLGASVADPEAVSRVFAAKGRASTQALPVLVASFEQLDQVCAEVGLLAKELAGRFWPGALSLVLRRHASVPAAIGGGGDTVAVRLPRHPAPLALIAECGTPITGTSANLSGGPQPDTAFEVVRQLGDAVDMVLDGGPCPVAAPSTILDLTTNPARLLRAGAVSIDELREVCAVTPLPNGVPPV